MNSKGLWAATLIAFAVGCGDEAGTPGAPDARGGAGTIKIGVAGPITGGEAKNGEDLVEGTTLAVEEWNAKGGIGGKRVEIVTRDDQADAKLASTVAGELVDAGVVGVVGHFDTGLSLPASEVYSRAGIVMITPASTNEYITDRKLPTVFRACGRDDQQAAAAAHFVLDVLKAKKVAIFDNKTPYGKGLADDFEMDVKGKVEIAVREGFDKSERNFRQILARVKDAHVDVWYFGGIYDQAAPLLLQARQLGITAPMMSGDGVHGYVDDFVKKVGSGAEGTLTTFPNTEAAPGYADFIKRFKARYSGTEPGPYAIYSYAAASMLLQAIADSGSGKGTDVAAALHEGRYETPLGTIEFDEKGDVRVGKSGSYVIWKVENGRFVLYGK